MASKNFTISQVGNILNTDANGVITSINSSEYQINLGPVGNITITGGNTGQFLSTDGTGNLTWANASGGGGGGGNANPMFDAYVGAPLSPLAGMRKVTFGVPATNVGDCYSSSRFTPNVAGMYAISCTLILGGDPRVGFSYGSIYLNGVDFRMMYLYNPNNSGNLKSLAQSSSCIVPMNGTTDYVEIYADATGSTIGYGSSFQGHYIGPLP